MTLAQWLALAKLARHALRLGLHHFVDVNELPQGSVRRLMAVLQKTFAAPSDDQAERLCATVESLGPVYIKLGQLFSTRRDLLPGPIVDALCKLQDRVDPIDAFAVSEAVSEHLGQPTSEVFRHIDAQPLASASIAQVHAATLHDGAEVVIKLVRPGISQRIHEDMHTLQALAAFLCRNSAVARRLHLDQVMRDHHAVLTRELDMFAEGRNQIQLRRNFADSPLLYVPRVYSQFSRRHMLVMERVYGVPIGQIDNLRAAGVDFQVLAHKGVETFFTQVFDHNFFHADMHPGNIQVDISNPADPSYIALDCAIVGSLEQQDIDYLAQNILAFFRRDYRAVVDLHLRSGWIPATTDADAFEQVIAQVCDPIFNKPLSEISFADFMTQLLRTARRLQYGDTTATGTATKNPTVRRRLGPPVVSATRSLGNRTTLYATLGGAQPWAAGGANATAGASAKAGGQSASTARATAPRYPTVAYRTGPATPDSGHLEPAGSAPRTPPTTGQNRYHAGRSISVGDTRADVTLAIRHEKEAKWTH